MGQQQCARPDACRRCRRFAAGMAAADHHHVESLVHRFSLVLAGLRLIAPHATFFSLHHLVQLLHTYGKSLASSSAGELGLPLPGESLLIAAAAVAGTTPQLNIALVIIAAALGAIAGQAAGYWIGRIVGFRLLGRYGRHVGLTPRRLAYGHALFHRHGVKVVSSHASSCCCGRYRLLAGRTACHGCRSWQRTWQAALYGRRFTGLEHTRSGMRRRRWLDRPPSSSA